MSLKELTAAKHKEVERKEFVKILFSGNIDPVFYATFLANQHPVYDFLEIMSSAYGLLNGLPELRRAPSIMEDFQELWPNKDEKPLYVPVVKEYLDYLKELSNRDPNLLFAHIYVRHMGDLSGGQMIAKKVPGKGKFYQFENVDKLKADIRERLDDSLADEANVCFNFASKMFEQLMELDIPKLKVNE